MPKATFRNLPAGKKKIISAAVKKEFLSHPYSEISINRIVKEADISRGSIYQYFSGKEDMLSWVLEDYCDYFIRIIKEALAEKKGDLFDTINLVLERIFEVDERNSNMDRMDKGQYGILFSDSRVVEMIVGKSCDKKNCPDGFVVVDAVRPYLRFDNLRIEAGEEDVFIQILVDSLCRPVIQYFNDGKNRYEECRRTMDLLEKQFRK